MHDFLDTASRLLSIGEINEKREHFERVFKAIPSLQAVHSKSQLDLNNIESIFTALEIANVLGKLPGFNKEEISGVIASLKEVIVTTLERTIVFPTIGSHIQPTISYQSFAELIGYLKNLANPALASSVITFNYDIALDVAMYRNGQGPIYGFGPDVSASTPTYLLKLHGSLNWGVISSNGKVQPLTLQEYFKKYRYQGFEEKGTCRIPIGSQLQEYYTNHSDSDLEVAPEPVIVPPTWNKADYHHLLSTIWGLAAKELEDAEYIFIIGYSLPETDAFFRLLYGLGSVGEVPIKKIIVFNTDETGIIEKRFRDMLGPGALARFEYRQISFDKCFNDIRLLFPKRV